MEVGEVYDHTFSFTQEQVDAFALVTGDDNPLHIDRDYAATTPFKRPIIHGFLGGSIFSRVFGTLWPGEGTIYLHQSLQFKRPMYVEESYNARFGVIALDERRHRATVRTEILTLQGKVTIDGEAIIQLPPK